MKYLKALLYTLIVTCSSGQTFTNFTSTDGLVDNNVTCGTYQGNGILWFGTQNGISKFDGVNWTNFTNATDTNLISNTITAIKTTTNGDLWVGTDFGVCKYANSMWTCFTTADGLGDDRVKYIEQSADGRIWIGEYDGLSIYDGANWTTYNLSDGLPFGGIQYITFDDNNDAWLGSGFGGFIHFDHTNFTVYNANDGLLNNIVNGIAIDSQNKKWVGSSSGISIFDNQNLWEKNHTMMYLLPPPDTLNPVMDLVFDSQNLLWVGIYVDYLLDGGVAMYNGYSWVDFNMSDGLVGPVISDLIIDDQDQVWVTTSSGISKITDVPAHIPQSFEDKISIYPNPSNGELVINSHNNSNFNLSIISISGEILTQFEFFSSLQIINLPLSSGIYILELIDEENNIFHKKIIRN